MLATLRQEWRGFKRGRPGHRFEKRYERNQDAESSQSWFLRLLKPTVAIILFAGGIVLCFIPGPGLPLIIIGAGLLADESRSVARVMDWLEVRARKVITWGRNWWDHASKPAKHAVIVLALLTAGGMAYGSYRIIFSH